MKEYVIKLDHYQGITVHVDGTSGVVEANIKDVCPYCQKDDCYSNCDESAGDISGLESKEQMQDRHNYNMMMDVVESMVLTHACSGIDVGSEEYIKGVKGTIDAITNNLPS